MAGEQAPAGNPFTPGFGSMPPLLVGRDDLFDDIQTALAVGTRHPSFTSVLLGPRGSGKTTAMLKIQDDAASVGWTVCDADALTRGADAPLPVSLTEMVVDQIEAINPPSGKQLTDLRVGPFGVGWSTQTSHRTSRLLERSLSSLADLTTREGGAGVLIQIDEFHNITEQEASVVASAVQRLAKKQDKPVAIICAGLPHMEHTLLASRGFTFFQRCKRHRIGNLSLCDAKQALRIPLEARDVAISEPLLCRAAGATRGHPYAIQALGYHLWEEGVAGAGLPPEEGHLLKAIDAMRRDLEENVMAPVWRRLSAKSRDFLAAMSVDVGTSKISDVAHRLQMSASVANSYRRRLLDEGVIVPAGHGMIEFADTGVRERAQAHHAELETRRRSFF